MADETEVTQTETVSADTSESDIPADISASMDEILSREPETKSSDDSSAEDAPDSTAVDNKDSAESKEEQVVETPAVAEEKPETIDTKALDSILAGKPEDVKIDIPAEINLNLDADIVGADVKLALDTMAKELSAQKQLLSRQAESLRVEQERMVAERNNAFTAKIDNHFDKFAKELPSVGISSKLTEKEAIERKRIFAHAKMESDIRNISIEQALEDTVKMFKSVGSESKIRETLITDLNKQKNKMLNTPTRKQSSPAARTYQTEEEKIRAEMDEVYNKIGIET